MKRTIYVVIGTALFVTGAIAFSWAQNGAKSLSEMALIKPLVIAGKPKTPSVPVAQAPKAPVVVPANPATIAPAAGTPAPAAPVQPTANPTTVQPAGSAPAAAAPVTDEKAFLPELKQNVENAFKDKLSFPLDEQKMLAFVGAALKVEKINSSWDVQIASAEKDEMAIEYNNFSVEEVTAALKSIPGLTLEQYNELIQLTSKNTDFNKLFFAYKRLVADGVYKLPDWPKKDAAKKADATGVIPPVMPPSGPQAVGTMPALQGSPAPQGSPPPVR